MDSLLEASSGDAEAGASKDAETPLLKDASGDEAAAWDVEAGVEVGAEAEEAASDAAEEEGGKPLVVEAQLIAASPTGATTPPTWNAHLPKLAGDSAFLYAVHTYYPQEVGSRYAIVSKRPRADPKAGWTEAAKILYPHQPPGIVVDTAGRLHLVFECLRPGSSDVECFQGGAGTSGLLSRFYHLVFASKNPEGSFRFDTYANYNEWTGAAQGYQGLGTTADGVTWWSLADASWNRVVQWWSSDTSYGTLPSLSKAPYYLLYPIQASHPVLGSGELILFAGEFDPAGGNNASYVASVAYSGSTAGLTELLENKHPSPTPGAVNAYPSDVAFAPEGTLYLLNYMPKGAGECTQLFRYEGGLSQAPTSLSVGCVGTYANLQVSTSGVLYVLTEGSGATMKLGSSADKGSSWVWQDVPLEGLPSNEDVSWYGMTVVKQYTSPTLYDPSQMLFFFAGGDASSLSKRSYLGVLKLP